MSFRVNACLRGVADSFRETEEPGGPLAALSLDVQEGRRRMFEPAPRAGPPDHA